MCVRIEDGGVCFFPVWRYFLFLVQQPGNKRSRCYNIAHIQFFSQCFFIVYVTICVCLQTWMSMTLYVNVMHAQLVFATFYYKLQNSICTPLNSSFFLFFLLSYRGGSESATNGGSQSDIADGSAAQRIFRRHRLASRSFVARRTHHHHFHHQHCHYLRSAKCARATSACETIKKHTAFSLIHCIFCTCLLI